MRDSTAKDTDWHRMFGEHIGGSRKCLSRPGWALDQQSQTSEQALAVADREQVNLVMPYVCARQAPGFAIHFNGASPG